MDAAGGARPKGEATRGEAEMHVEQGSTNTAVADRGAVARVAKRRRVEAAAHSGGGSDACGEAALDAAVSQPPASAPGSGQPPNPIQECETRSDTPAALGAQAGAVPCRHLCKYNSCVLHLPIPCMRDLLLEVFDEWEAGGRQQHYERKVAVYAAISQAPQLQPGREGQAGQQQGQGQGQGQEPRLWRFEVRLLRRSYLSTWRLVGFGAVATVLGLFKAGSTKSLNSVWLSRTADGRLLAEREDAHSGYETHVAQTRPAVGRAGGLSEVEVEAAKRATAAPAAAAAGGAGGGSSTAPAAQRRGRGRARSVPVTLQQQAAPAAAVDSVRGVDLRFAGRISHRSLWPRSGALELLCPELVVAAHAGATDQLLTVYAEVGPGTEPGPTGAARSGQAASLGGEGQHGVMRPYDLRLTLVPQGGKFYASGCGPLLRDLGVSKKSVPVWLRKLEDGRLVVELAEEGRKERQAGKAEAQEASAPRDCNCHTGRGVLWVKVAAVKAVWRARYDAWDAAAEVWDAGEVSVYPVAREARGRQVQQQQQEEEQLRQAVKLRLLCRCVHMWCARALG